jgi:predicted enzyme related to lactoylglutathione lyase
VLKRLPNRGLVPWLLTGTLAQTLGLGLGIMTISAIGFLPGAASAADLAPLNVPASDESHVGKWIFAELVTPDLAAAKQFYGKLFGWTFQDYEQRGGMFTEASVDGQVVGGIYQRPLPEGRRPGWIAFIATRDLAQTAALAAQNGARVLLSPRPLGDLGQEAVLADPQGAVFGVLQSNSGDPPDLLVAPGDWIWRSLIATDPVADAAFYKAVFGYEIFDMPDQEDTRHLMLASDNYARSSVNPIPAAWTAATPRWLSYIRVDDATAMTAEVTALGGRVLQPPRIDRHGGKIAVVADPAGALFGLMEWPEDAPAGNAK